MLTPPIVVGHTLSGSTLTAFNLLVDALLTLDLTGGDRARDAARHVAKAIDTLTGALAEHMPDEVHDAYVARFNAYNEAVSRLTEQQPQ